MIKDLQEAEPSSAASLIAEAEDLVMPTTPPDDDVSLTIEGPLDGALVDDSGEAMVLGLSDLLPDSAGDIVLFAGEDLRVNLVTNEKVADSGVVEDYVTASGVDVTGHYFYNFESGVTVYSAGDLIITTEPDAS